MKKILLLLLTLFIVSCATDAKGGQNSDGVIGDNYVNRGINEYNNNNYPEAIILMKKGLEAGVSFWPEEQIWTMVGNLHMELMEYEEAEEAHKRALKVDENSYKALVNLGVVYRLTDRYDEAEACYIKALSIKPDYPALHASLGALYVFEGDPEKAVSYLKRSVQLDPQLAIGWANLSLALALLDRMEESQEAFEKAGLLDYPNMDNLRIMLEDLK